MDFAIMSMVAKVTAQATPNEAHVGRSCQGPLPPQKSPRVDPREGHFLKSKKLLIYAAINILLLQLSSMV
jgi:hypothetical protein